MCVLFLVLKEIFLQFFTVQYNFSFELVIYAICYAELYSFHTYSVEIFNYKWMLNFAKIFYVSIEIIV